MEDDFVVDDGVGGYVDNGMDDWAGGDPDAEESDEEYDKPKKGLFFTPMAILIAL
jgi:DNA polymerase alpha subunit A